MFKMLNGEKTIMAPKLKNFITAVEMQRKVQADVKKASSIKQPQGTKEEKPPKTPPKPAETFFTTQDLRDPFDRLGEGRVGKTSLLRRYVTNSFDDKEASTQAAAYLEKRLQIRGQQVDLSLWDTAGQERFHSLAPLYYRDADGAILVYDITELQSFERVAKWVKELRQICTRPCALSIVGDKADLRGLAQVNAQDAEDYARSIGGFHSLVSAKSGQGVEDAFLRMADAVLTMRSRGGSRRSLPTGQPGRPPVNLVGPDVPQGGANSPTRRKKGCCAGGGSDRDPLAGPG